MSFHPYARTDSTLANFQPRFLSKEDRAKLAIAKRAQEIKEQKERDEKAKKDREALEREAEEFRNKDRNQANRYGGGSTRCQSY
jgi:ATP-dependent RNA helicase DDX23/PRP28